MTACYITDQASFVGLKSCATIRQSQGNIQPFLSNNYINDKNMLYFCCVTQCFSLSLITHKLKLRKHRLAYDFHFRFMHEADVSYQKSSFQCNGSNFSTA